MSAMRILQPAIQTLAWYIWSTHLKGAADRGLAAAAGWLKLFDTSSSRNLGGVRALPSVRLGWLEATSGLRFRRCRGWPAAATRNTQHKTCQHILLSNTFCWWVQGGFINRAETGT